MDETRVKKAHQAVNEARKALKSTSKELRDAVAPTKEELERFDQEIELDLFCGGPEPWDSIDHDADIAETVLGYRAAAEEESENTRGI